MCFPAIASLGSAIGLGFLQQYEGLFLNTIIPIVVWFALVVNLLGWFAHRQWYRTLLGITGPTFYLLAFYPWFQYGWSTYVTYGSLAFMVAVSIWDMIWPANKRCDDQCELKT